MFKMRHSIITIFMSIFLLTGCQGPQPLSMVGHGVNQIKSEPLWSRDFGPERSGHFEHAKRQCVMAASFPRSGGGGTADP